MQRTMSWLHIEMILLQDTNGEMICSFGEDRNLVRERVEKFARIVPCSIFLMLMRMSKAIR